MIPWTSAHLFHAGDLDALIIRVVAPLVADLTPRRFFFLRYWEGGPHLRVRLLPSSPSHARSIERELLRRGRAHLAAHASHRSLTIESYAVQAARHAHGERLDRHDTRLHPNDTVEFIPYQPEQHIFGAMEPVERHFTDSSRLAMNLLRSHPDHAQRAASVLAAVTMTLSACGADPDAFRLPSLPPIVRQAYDARHDDLRRQTRGLWTDTRGRDGWQRSIRRLRHGLGRPPPGTRSPLGFLSHAVPAERRAAADILLRCTHLLANRLGLPQPAEVHVGLLAAHILSDLSKTGDLS
ncbi:lantibiotic dehydratase C-terminal domain-containing protein [Nonomuraea insulae]|uniref:Lantibiotic dehydratase C-terminal domain-containing protein n=1 Tax=Nonomuraea insulae TaxID=1616787 RepID=A0ABW1CNJ4_9ACTN